MAFNAVSNLISGKPPVAPPKDNYPFEVDETTMSAGQVAYLSNGLLKHGTDDRDTCAVIVLEDGEDGDDVQCEWILPGTVYKTTVNEGTASSIVLGDSYEISSDYLGVNQGASGPLTVIRQDPNNDDIVWVVFNSCLLVGSDKRT